MPALPCAKHPNELTYVRCGRCDKPICVRCMVDTPVGKKCRECAQNRTHLSEWTPRQVVLAFVAALVVALPAGWLMHRIPIVPLAAFPYGFVVAEAALRAGGRSRSGPVQLAAGVAALIGGVLGVDPDGPFGPAWIGFSWPAVLAPFSLILIGLGVAAAVSRVRFL